ncbi:MAG: FkbM family methyltransferase [Candidatus Omnitrophica bacterium]|nr:FkbM family methyltransferase [Candidatus Omnitrophota bacterium]
MPADSAARKLLKQAMYPLLNERTYRVIQGLAKAWDIRRGTWTEPEVDVVRLAVREGETTIDIGANFGLYCYHLSRAVGRSGRVYAFEPVPFTYATCRLVGRLLGIQNVELFGKGCGNRNGRVAFTLPVQRSGAISAGLAHFAGRNDQRKGKDLYAPYDQTREVWCEVVALDDFLPELTDVSLLKSDIEGADLLALQGAARLIERHHPTILCEIEPWFLEGFGIKPQALGAFFRERDYRMYHYDVVDPSTRPADGQGTLTPASIERLGTFSSHNYVLIHPSRRDRLASLLNPQDIPSTKSQ